MFKKRTEMKVDIGKAVKASLIGIPVAIILFVLLFFVIKGFDKTYYKGMSRKMYFTVSDEGRILRGNYNGKAVYSKGMSNIYFLKTDADHVSLEVALEKEKVVFEEIDGFKELRVVENEEKLYEYKDFYISETSVEYLIYPNDNR